MYKSVILAIPAAILLTACVGGSSDEQVEQRPQTGSSVERYILGLPSDVTVEDFLDNKNEKQSAKLKNAEAYLTTAYSDAALTATNANLLSGQGDYEGGYFATTSNARPGDDQSMTGHIKMHLDFTTGDLSGSISDVELSDGMTGHLSDEPGAMTLSGRVEGNKLTATLGGAIGPDGGVPMQGTLTGDLRGHSGEKAVGSIEASEVGSGIEWLGIFSAARQ